MVKPASSNTWVSFKNTLASTQKGAEDHEGIMKYISSLFYTESKISCFSLISVVRRQNTFNTVDYIRKDFLDNILLNITTLRMNKNIRI